MIASHFRKYLYYFIILLVFAFYSPTQGAEVIIKPQVGLGIWNAPLRGDFGLLTEASVKLSCESYAPCRLGVEQLLFSEFQVVFSPYRFLYAAPYALFRLQGPSFRKSSWLVLGVGEFEFERNPRVLDTDAKVILRVLEARIEKEKTFRYGQAGVHFGMSGPGVVYLDYFSHMQPFTGFSFVTLKFNAYARFQIKAFSFSLGTKFLSDLTVGRSGGPLPDQLGNFGSLLTHMWLSCWIRIGSSLPELSSMHRAWAWYAQAEGKIQILLDSGNQSMNVAPSVMASAGIEF